MGLALAPMLLIAVARADEPGPSSNARGAATTEPIPKNSYLRLEPSYTFVEDGGSMFDLHLRVVLVYRGWLVPGRETGRVMSAVGVDLSFAHESTATVHATGLGRVELTQLSGITFARAIAGAGVAIGLPTATNPAFGGDAIQVGPAVFGQVTATRSIELAILARTFFPVTGDPSNSILTRLEPAVIVPLGEAFALSSDGEIDIDWNAGTSRVPINLILGYSIGRRVLVQAGPELDVAGPTRGNLRLDFRIDFIDR